MMGCEHCHVIPQCCGNLTRGGDCRADCAVPSYECSGGCHHYAEMEAAYAAQLEADYALAERGPQPASGDESMQAEAAPAAEHSPRSAS